jgi:polyisoprenoid-binding protein YceI
MQNYLKIFVFMFISIVGLNNIGYSQNTYKIEDTKDVNIRLLGTSTLHNWEMEATAVSGEAQFIFKAGSKSDLISLKSLSFALKVKDLESDSKELDKNAYKALKSDEFKDIHYSLISTTVTFEKANEYLLKTKGKLTIAGVTKEIEMNVHCFINNDGSITCKGSNKLNMTDYNVNPPTFLFGAMKTGDAITLEFNVVYKI